MDRLEKASLIALHSISGIGQISLQKIKSEFGSFRACLLASSNKINSSALTTAVRDGINSKRDVDLNKIITDFESSGSEMITQDEEAFPQLLKHINPAPYIFYYRGRIELASSLGIAIVGSRKASNYGKMVARKLGSELAINGVTVISGLARGIDTEAHLGALSVEGKTIAVLGSGLDIVYPRENRNVLKQIGDTGLIISEFPLGFPPESRNFPQRNRIIAGLSKGVVVVEAEIKSGALITVDYALEQGKDVFAVPGPITSSTSRGTNNLLKQGAKVTTEVEDILEDLFFVPEVKNRTFSQPEIDLSPAEKTILDFLDFNPIHMEKLLLLSGLNVGELSKILLKLEFSGLLVTLPGNYYVRSNF